MLDAEKRLRYRGRIDDQYRLRGHPQGSRRRHDLKDALDAVLAGKQVATPETEVDGCLITFPKPRKPRDVTYRRTRRADPARSTAGSAIAPAARRRSR